MTSGDPYDLLDPVQRDRARQLGSERYLGSGTYRDVRSSLFRVLDGLAARADPTQEPVGPLLGAGASRLLRQHRGTIDHLSRRKVAAYREGGTPRDELFDLYGLRVAEEYLRSRGGPRRRWRRGRRERPADFAASVQIDDAIAQARKDLASRSAEASSMSTSPLRALANRFQACADDCTHSCGFEASWCRVLTENTISLNSYVVPELRRFRESGAVPLKLDAAVSTWLAAHDPRHLLLLGDSGLGKTSACLHLFRQLAKNAAAGAPGSLVPVYVPLDAFAQSRPTSGRLADLLEHALGLDDLPNDIDPTVPPAQRLYLLDGLDEMSRSATVNGIGANLAFLRPFLASGSRVVLTCRTHLFASSGDLENALRNLSTTTDILAHVRKNEDFEIVELQPLSDTAIQRVIGAELHEEPDAVWREINNYYDLPDLSARPVLLGVILRSLSQVRERAKSDRPIDEAGLYDAYIEQWALREQSRRLSQVSVDDKLALAQAIAVSMYRREIRAIDRAALEAEVHATHGSAIRSLLDFEMFDYDARDASFLTSDLAGNYRFMHGSFLEYFTARAFRDELCGSRSAGAWGSRWLGRQSARFVTQMVESPDLPDAIARLVRLAATTEDATELWNALHILSLVKPAAVGDDEREVIAKQLVPRGFTDTSAVIVRQDARVAAQYVSPDLGEQLINRLLEIVMDDPCERVANNDTYINYYGGVEPACFAFLSHLAEPVRKYDRLLHIHLLGQFGSPAHAAKLRERSLSWSSTDADAAHEAIREIVTRV